jgi:hypothetical protein
MTLTKTHIRRFLKALSANRRSVIHQLRHETGPKIFPLLAEMGHIKLKDRETHITFISALKSPGNDEYSKFPPRLFPPGHDQALTKLFRVEQLPLVIDFIVNTTENRQILQMLRSILFAPGSLTEKKAPSPKTMGKLWGVVCVTPGSIAFITVLVRR